MNNRRNITRILIVGFLVVGTIIASAKTISILHSNQPVQNEANVLQGVLPTTTPSSTENTPPIDNTSQIIDKYTLSQVALHNSPADCWIIILNKIYNVTSFIPNHPGGAGAIIPYCGKDSTTAFQTHGSSGGSNHSAYAYSLLNSYYVAPLSSGLTSTSTSISPSISTQNPKISAIPAIKKTATVPQKITTQKTPAVSSSNSTTYTASQVAAHNTQSDCWLIISGKVYNVTSFIPNHPGGVNAIVSRCGTDATIAYTVEGNGGHAHSAYAQSLLPTYYIGSLASSTDTTQTTTPTTYTLAVTNSGTGSGTVSGGSISCGSTCSTTLNSGTSVTLTATAANGSSFVAWGGACSGTANCSVTMNSNQNVTVTFNATATTPPPPSTFTLSVVSANGTVTSNPSAISCGSTCSTTLNSGTSLILIVIPNSGFTFSGWSGDCSGTNSSCTVSMDSNKNVTANYQAN